MISIIIEVSCDKDIYEKISDASSQFSASKIKFICKDFESHETVDIIYWNELDGYSHFLH